MSSTPFQLGTLLATCILISGCTVCENARRTMRYEPAAYSWKYDRRRSVEVYRHWAEQAWREESVYCQEMLAGDDYILGFHDGFLDYVYAGGSGEPPPVPPRQFWNVMLRSPEGKLRADQWFDGYRHGARVARDGGYRDLGTIRSSLIGLGDSGLPEYPADIHGPNEEMGLEWHPAEGLPEPTATPQIPTLNTPANETASGAGSKLEDSPEAPKPADETTDSATTSQTDLLSEPLDDTTAPVDEPETEPENNEGVHDVDRPIPQPIAAVAATFGGDIEIESPRRDRPIADPAVSTVEFVSEAARENHQPERPAVQEPAIVPLGDVKHEVQVLPRIVITSRPPAKSKPADGVVSKRKASTIKIRGDAENAPRTILRDQPYHVSTLQQSFTR